MQYAAFIAFFFSATAAGAQEAPEKWLLITSACGQISDKVRCNTFNAAAFFTTEEACLRIVPQIEAGNIQAGRNVGLESTWAWSGCFRVQGKPGEAS